MRWYDEIAKLARALYEKSGGVEGRDLDNWLEAERIVMERYKKQEMLEKESAFPVKKKSKKSHQHNRG